MGNQSWLLLLIVAVPLAAGLAILARGADVRREGLVRAISVTSTVVVLALLGLLVGTGRDAEFVLELAAGLHLRMGWDRMGILFAGLTSTLWLFAVIYCLGYMTPGKPGNARFFAYVTLAQASVLGIALSRNLLTLYAFYEALTFLTYPLVIHKGSDEALAAGRIYIVYSLTGAALVLVGMVGLQSTYGELLFRSGGCLGSVPTAAAPFFIALVLGFGVKAAIMPLHGWLPLAMIAPTPVSALLHAVAVVKSGVFGVLRVIFGVFGAGVLTDMGMARPVTVMCLITIIVASFVALRQDVLKRRLAYSTVAQLAYITLGASLLTDTALNGALLHMINHALLKCVLFFSAGVIISQSGVDRISGLNGVSRRFPVVMACFTAASLGMVGVLPTNGFVGKWNLISGSLEAGLAAPAAALVISALLCALYLLPISVRAYLSPGSFERPERLEAPAAMVYPVVILTVVSMAIGLWPGPLVRLAAWVTAGTLVP